MNQEAIQQKTNYEQTVSHNSVWQISDQTE